jgi:hypothetical protein
MPLITDVLKETDRKKNFQKKAYRPWDDDMSVYNNDDKVMDEDFVNDQEVLHDRVEAVGMPSQTYTEKNQLLPTSQVIDFKETSEAVEIDKEKCLRDLYGAQRIIFKFLIMMPVQDKGGIFVTEPVSTNEIALSIKLPINTIKTVIGRFKSKKLLDSYENKPGRGGYGRYSFSKDLYEFFVKKFTEE